MKALIGSDIWSDPDFEDLSAAAKLIVFWLLTSPSRDNTGVVRVSERRVAFECSIPEPREIMKEAVQSGSFVVEGDRIWIRNWITKQIGHGDSLVRNNIMKSVQKCIQGYPKALRQQIFKQYPELLPTPSKGGDQPPPEPQGKEREGKVRGNTKATLIDEFAGSLAELYGSTLNAINPESKRVAWDRGITKKEAARVLLYVKKHRAGSLKDEPLIPTTANRALLGIGDLIERALAAYLPSKKDFVVKPMPVIEHKEMTPEELKEVKKGVAALKKKLNRKTNKENEE